ncbi:MAG: TPM domain-containing protein [Phycisphaeraceae bacterium]|nr:TPM domain-containing protein [Phycisphaeraceae bacterium]
MVKPLLILLCLLATTASLAGAPYPQPDAGYVTDLAGLLSAGEQEQIEQWLWQVEEKTGTEIAVVTIPSMSKYPGAATGSIESFARGLFDAWDIGNMPENKGVLLLVSVGDRKARIELGAGYGSGMDRQASAIMQRDIIPQFKNNDYAGGITAGVVSIMQTFANAAPAPGSAGASGASGGGVFGMSGSSLLIDLAIIAVCTLIGISLYRHGKRGWGWIAIGLLIVLTLFALRSLLRVTVELAQSSGQGSSGGWSSGGFGGSFGGGFSGGGGATGSW